MEKYLYDDLKKLEDLHWWHIAKRKTTIALLKKFKVYKNLKLLDIGCGTGRTIEDLKQFGEVWGVDTSAEAIKFCRQRGLKNISLVKDNRLNFSDNFFDIITLLDVLEHTDDKKILKEVKRILKPKGLLFITVPSYQWLWSKWDLVLHHQRRYSKGTLKQTLKNCNFEVKKISYLYSFLLIPVILTRMIKSIFYKKYYPSDFKLSSKLINNLCLIISDLERKLLLKYNIPFGTSLVCVALKNEK